MASSNSGRGGGFGNRLVGARAAGYKNVKSYAQANRRDFRARSGA